VSSKGQAGVKTAHTLVGEQLEELIRDARRPWHRRPRFLRELGDLAEHGQVLVGDLERRGDDKEEIVHWPRVDRLIVDPGSRMAVGQAQAWNHEGATMRDGDPATYPGGAERLPALEHPEQRVGGTLVRVEQFDQFRQHLFLARRGELELDGVIAEEIAQEHGPTGGERGRAGGPRCGAPN
jgi:hypothetical protein